MDTATATGECKMLTDRQTTMTWIDRELRTREFFVVLMFYVWLGMILYLIPILRTGWEPKQVIPVALALILWTALWYFAAQLYYYRPMPIWVEEMLRAAVRERVAQQLGPTPSRIARVDALLRLEREANRERRKC